MLYRSACVRTYEMKAPAVSVEVSKLHNIKLLAISNSFNFMHTLYSDEHVCINGACR